MNNPVVVDLGDFIPEEYNFAFSICGRKYAFQYAEATVDEVFQLIAQEQIEPGKLPEIRKKVVTAFLKKHLTEGDPVQFEQDMATVPYDRPGAPFDIIRLYAPLMMRVKKNGHGATNGNPS